MTVTIDQILRIVQFTGNKADIETGDGTIEEGGLAYASDVNEIGIYTAGDWVWIAAMSFNDAEGNPVDVDNTAAADGTSTHVARRDHRHHLGSHTHASTDITGVIATGEILMRDGASAPPIPLETEDGTDWLYQG